MGDEEAEEEKEDRGVALGGHSVEPSRNAAFEL